MRKRQFGVLHWGETATKILPLCVVRGAYKFVIILRKYHKPCVFLYGTYICRYIGSLLNVNKDQSRAVFIAFNIAVLCLKTLNILLSMDADGNGVRKFSQGAKIGL